MSTTQAITVLNWPADQYGPPEPLITARPIRTGSITTTTLDPIEWPEGFAETLGKQLEMMDAIRAQRAAERALRKRSFFARLFRR